jgi:ribosomal protein S12 methylthiotransferase accessory factor
VTRPDGLSRPIFNPAYRVEVLPPEGVYMLSERGQRVLKGRVNCLVAPLVDGKHTVDQIVDELDGQASPAEVYYVLALLERRGYLVDAEDTLPPGVAALWAAVGVTPDTVTERLSATPIGVTVVGELDSGLKLALEAALVASGACLDQPVGFDVVLTDDYIGHGLFEVNDRALESGRPWLLAKPLGTIAWIGPAFWPGRTACWACLAQRLYANREVENYLEGRLGQQVHPPLSVANLAATEQVGVGLTAVEALRSVVRGGPAEGGLTMLTVDVLDGTSQRHTVIRRPQCPRCGDGSYRPGRPGIAVSIGSSPKATRRDGGHRAEVAERTIERYRHHVSPVSGAVTALIPVATGVDDLHVYVAGHNFATRRTDLSSLRRGLRSKSAGKGMGDAQARASGLCEALERYSGLFQGYEVQRSASFSELGEAAIHPNRCMNFSAKQYEDREEWNRRGSQFQIVPVRFDPDATLDWSTVWSLTHDRFSYLPTGYLYYGYPLPGEQFFFWPDSNGNAAGTTLEEAILQGFMELVERDSVCIWWYNRLARPGVDLDTFDEPYFATLQEAYARLHRELWVIDITSDLGIPSFAAVTRRVDLPVEDSMMAFGAHFDPAVAIGRALCELNQFLPAVLPRGSDGSGEYAFDDPDAIRWWKTARVAEHTYLLPSSAEPARSSRDYVDRSSEDLGEDVRRCQELVESKGMEMLVLDQTRPDLGLPVAKVIVPGMRHFWARFGPGRLYDVPVEQGWLDVPTAEEDLNPVAMFV